MELDEPGIEEDLKDFNEITMPSSDDDEEENA